VGIALGMDSLTSIKLLAAAPAQHKKTKRKNEPFVENKV